jgi:hypothetical protein
VSRPLGAKPSIAPTPPPPRGVRLVDRTSAAVTEAEIRWFDSVLAGLDYGSIILEPTRLREATTRLEN